jgi:hypothetical protein
VGSKVKPGTCLAVPVQDTVVGVVFFKVSDIAHTNPARRLHGNGVNEGYPSFAER